MMRVAVATCAAFGTYLLWSSASSWRLAPQPSRRRGGLPRAARARAEDWLVQAGLGEVRWRDFGAVMVALGSATFAVVFVTFGALLPAILVGVVAGAAPVGSYRRRRVQRWFRSQESWPRLLEEMRILTSNVGRSVPQALFDVGRRAPDEMRGAFEAAHREWVLSTDFARTLTVLKAGLADPTADAVAETLLVAHQVGGTDLDVRLAALIEDRVQDVQGRKDFRARQAGVRFARRFVLVVPAGMALVGLTIGNGREAYSTSFGQTMVVIGIGATAACWWWAGRMLRLPSEPRVFDR